MKRYVNRITPATRRERCVEKALFNPWRADFPEEAEDWYGDLAPARGRHRPPTNEWDDPTWVAVDLRDWETLVAEDIDRIRQKSKAKSNDGFVYYCRYRRDGLIKIGTSRDVDERMVHLGAQLLATEPGGYAVEAVRHFQFEPLRSHGEWFRPEAPLLSHIESLQELAVAS